MRRIQLESVDTTARSHPWWTHGDLHGLQVRVKPTLNFHLVSCSSIPWATARCTTTLQVKATSARRLRPDLPDCGGRRHRDMGLCPTRRSPTRTWPCRTIRPTAPCRILSTVNRVVTQVSTSTARTYPCACGSFCVCSAILLVGSFVVSCRLACMHPKHAPLCASVLRCILAPVDADCVCTVGCGVPGSNNQRRHGWRVRPSRRSTTCLSTLSAPLRDA